MPTPPEGPDDGPEEEDSRVDRWRQNSAAGALTAAMAMGLQHALEPVDHDTRVELEVEDQPVDFKGVEFHFEPGDAGQSFVVVRPPPPPE